MVRDTQDTTHTRDTHEPGHDSASVHSPDPTAGSGWAGAVPNLGAQTVVGVFESPAAMEEALSALRAEGFSDEEISIVRQGEGESAPHTTTDDTQSGKTTTAGATAGAVLGGLVGLAALAIPGIGPLLAAGPLAVALGGAVAGGALGGLVGSFAGLGIPTKEAEEYEAAVRSGGAFMSVKTSDSDAADRVQKTLERHGARQVSSFQPSL